MPRSLSLDISACVSQVGRYSLEGAAASLVGCTEPSKAPGLHAMQQIVVALRILLLLLLLLLLLRRSSAMSSLPVPSG
jgi:hypothetical protein